jgi:hypothetical protein
MTQKNFLEKIKKVQKKMQNLTLISNPLKQNFKNAQKKVRSKTSLPNMSKSENSAYFRHIFANNFFGAFFQNFFNGFKISVKFSIF